MVSNRFRRGKWPRFPPSGTARKNEGLPLTFALETSASSASSLGPTGGPPRDFQRTEKRSGNRLNTQGSQGFSRLVPGAGVGRGIGTLREGLVFAGLVRGGPPGHPPPNSGRPTGASASNPMGLGWMTWGSRRGWNREGADSPAGKSVAKTGPGAQERSPCPARSPEAFATSSPPHAPVQGLRPLGCFPSGAIQASGAIPRAALSGNRSRSGTLSRFAELHPEGFDPRRDGQDPPAESLRIAPIPGLRDRFSRKNLHALRPTGHPFPLGSLPGLSPSPPPSHPQGFQAKTGPGAQERSPCPARSSEAFATPSPPHGPVPGLRAWGCFPSGAIQASGALPRAALSRNRSRSGTLSRFAELHPEGFDPRRDGQDPPAESLRIAPIPRLRDRFSRKNPHAPA